MEPWGITLIGVGVGYFLANLDSLGKALFVAYILRKVTKTLSQSDTKEDRKQ